MIGRPFTSPADHTDILGIRRNARGQETNSILKCFPLYFACPHRFQSERIHRIRSRRRYGAPEGEGGARGERIRCRKLEFSSERALAQLRRNGSYERGLEATLGDLQPSLLVIDFFSPLHYFSSRRRQTAADQRLPLPTGFQGNSTQEQRLALEIPSSRQL